MKQKIDEVSILIPVYNRNNLILETMESAINQDYENFEIIIVDNYSNDGTYELLRKTYKRNKKVKLYRNEKNIGPVKNWIKCLEYARGDYIKILWSDDLISKDYLKRTVPILKKYDDVGFVYSSVEIFSESKKQLSYVLGKTGKYSSDIFLKGVILEIYPLPVSPGCALFRKKDIVIHNSIPNKLDLNHSDNGAGVDLLIFLETLIKYKKFYYINETLSFFRIHKDSITISNFLSNEYLTAKYFYLTKYKLFKYIITFNTLTYIRKCFRNKRLLNKNEVLSKYNMKEIPKYYNCRIGVKYLWIILFTKIKQRLYLAINKYFQ